VQRGPDPPDTEQVGDRLMGAERDRLGQVADLTGDTKHAGSRPVRPGPMDTVTSDSTGWPSGQLKERSEQEIADCMSAAPSTQEGFSGTCGDTTPGGAASLAQNSTLTPACRH
jgi:hypothetical protein